MKRWILILICVFGLTGAWDFNGVAEPGPSLAGYYEVWKQLGPAIVGISCQAELDAPGLPGPLFFHGSGSIIQKDGLILTATSVVPPKATNIKVRLKDGKEYPAKTVFMDEDNEITLLDIAADDLPLLGLGDSDKVKVGDAVYTFGDSLQSIISDDQAAFSWGVVSGIYSLENENAYHLEQFTGKYKGKVLETTAAVNGGIDGGPLISPDGQIIGIILLSYSKSRRLGIALPSSVIKSAIKKHLKTESAPPLTLTPPLSFNHISNKTKQWVVGLKITYEEKPPPTEPPPNQEPGGIPPDSPEELAQRKEYATRPPGLLSGLIVDAAKGYVITSYQHIAGKVKEVYVIQQTDKDKSEFPAKVVGWSQDLDLALVKTERKLTGTSVTFSDKIDLKVGQWAIVVGNNPDPTALEPTLTVGIVSAVDRLLNGKAFQLDARINYGNIGGGVFDIEGNFIGLAGQFAQPLEWGLNSGIALAVNARAIKELLPDLIAGKKIEKTPTPFLGVQLARGAVDIKGVKVEQVIPDSAADKAGLKAGDIIIQLDDKPINDFKQLVNTIRNYKVKDKVKIKVQRDDKTVEVAAILGQK